jgi:hypothetical protein
MRNPSLHDPAQTWKLTRDTTTGLNRIVPMSQTTKSIDIVNDGKNNRPWLDNTANLSGQLWKLTMTKIR